MGGHEQGWNHLTYEIILKMVDSHRYVPSEGRQGCPCPCSPRAAWTWTIVPAPLSSSRIPMALETGFLLLLFSTLFFCSSGQVFVGPSSRQNRGTF